MSYSTYPLKMFVWDALLIWDRVRGLIVMSYSMYRLKMFVWDALLIWDRMRGHSDEIVSYVCIYISYFQV